MLSSSRGRISASNNEGGLGRLLEPDFDIDFNVSVESYSSPPREVARHFVNCACIGFGLNLA